MNYTDKLIGALKQFEGCQLKAYRDSAGVLTIGYGHTGPDVKAGQSITQDRAEALLRQDLNRAATQLDGLKIKYGTRELTPAQQDALLDFAYNLGTGALRGSTLLKQIRAGLPSADIQAQFRRWVYAGGKKLAGLVRRREWEAKRWTE